MLTSDEILGKEAIDSEGELLGVVMKLHIDPIQKSILGITIDTGLWTPDLYIGIDFINQFGIDAIFLNAIPNSKYKNLSVFTFDGKNIGKIFQVQETNLNQREFIIRLNTSWKKFFQKRKYIKIPESSIQEFGYSLILKKNYKLDALKAN